jgi:hypothetical protein
MVPETYNTKQEFFVNVCKSCNWLCNSFRQALLEGDRDQAVALFATGNVNLHTPFANVKGELFYPVHCAVLGNNCDLLRFLVDEQCCPIKSVRVNASSSSSGSSGKGNGGRNQTTHTPIVTSRGRSLLGMAMEQNNMEIVRYLIVEKGVNSAAEPDVTRELLGNILYQALMRMMPPVRPILPLSDHDDYPYVNHAAFFATRESSGASDASSSSLVLPKQPSMPPSAPPSNEDQQQQQQQQQQQRTISEEARDFGAVAISAGRLRREPQSDVAGAAAVVAANEECTCRALSDRCIR